MQIILPSGLLNDLPGTSFRQPEPPRTAIEHLMEFVLTQTLAPNTPAGVERIAEQVLNFDVRGARLVILGGGTGLSTVVGGNSQRSDWPDQPHLGAKNDFPQLQSIVCTTDDGGSTGKLLQALPMIGVGDLRKILISSISCGNIRRIYGIGEPEGHAVIRLIHGVLNYRFPDQTASFEIVKNPLLAAPAELRPMCPESLGLSLRRLGAFVSPGGAGPTIFPAGHSLGNILLTSAIFMAAHGCTSRPPRTSELQAGIDAIAALIGAPVGQIHAATSAPGQLKIRYANGVEVYGQSKSARSRRSSPVERVSVEFTRKPLVSATVLRSIERADIIVYAPGSLYTSIMPILRLDPIASAIRGNERALKILGANFWAQEGETDISLKNQSRGFLVSELIEAYDRNLPGGIDSLFDVVLSANLEHVPVNILRNYALEGKSPIHLDRHQVESMGVQPLEATLLSAEHEKKMQVIHHDAARFTMAIRTLLYADKFLQGEKGYVLRRRRPQRKAGPAIECNPNRESTGFRRSPALCSYLQSVKRILNEKEFQPTELCELLIELAWENRDINLSHLDFFRGAVVIPAGDWGRSTEWDNVLGYYDPQDQYLKLHQNLLTKPLRLREDLTVALGESLLGRYMVTRRWMERQGARCYEIVLRPAAKQESFLTDEQLRAFLKLSRMTPDPVNNRIFRITINDDEGFLPPGLLFGLTYAWYLSGNGLTMEYEMSLLHWPSKSLMPLHAKDRARKEALVSFFRTEIFGHH
jgi:uncharacterized cofD-like protein